MNNDLVQNIVDIFGNKQIYYNIPDYQRGYEWRDNDVKLLLSDLQKFSRQLSGKDEDIKGKFYCLQHITILKKEWMKICHITMSLMVNNVSQQWQSFYLILGKGI